jgi:hypothetical protein
MTPAIWTNGYTQTELDDAQAKFGLVFPPDLVALLRDRRPLKGHWWSDEVAIRRMLDWPFEGLLFDVEHNTLWWPEWGQRPISPEARSEVLCSVVSRAPKLIPLYSHRYLPEEPHESGNPVFSVHQSDVVCYGADLEDYLEREFGDHRRPMRDQIKYIPFWSDLVKRNGLYGGL